MCMDKKHVKPDNVYINIYIYSIYIYPTLSNTKLNNNGLIGLIDPEHLRVRTNEAELSCSDMAWRWGPSPKIRPEPHPGVMKNNSQTTRSCPLVDLVDLVVVNHQLLILEDLPPLKRVLWISDSDP